MAAEGEWTHLQRFTAADHCYVYIHMQKFLFIVTIKKHIILKSTSTLLPIGLYTLILATKPNIENAVFWDVTPSGFCKK
jgi:hypothetical protein